MLYIFKDLPGEDPWTQLPCGYFIILYRPRYFPNLNVKWCACVPFSLPVPRKKTTPKMSTAWLVLSTGSLGCPPTWRHHLGPWPKQSATGWITQAVTSERCCALLEFWCRHNRAGQLLFCLQPTVLVRGTHDTPRPVSTHWEGAPRCRARLG